MRVCIIGAGAAGLCAARRVASVREWPDPVVYEQSDSVGGTWVYNPEADQAVGSVVHSSMYKNMKTNLPKEVMGFPDWPFWVDGPSFISHFQVARYLEGYCSEFSLRRFIKFSTSVLNVSPVVAEGDNADRDSCAPGWVVDTLHRETDVTESVVFDAVFVCNGHYTKPYSAPMPCADSFRGSIVHSHWYRVPDPYQGRVVACLGAGPSGTDIGLEIAGVAEHVYLCHDKARIKSELAANMTETVGIRSLSSNSATLNDGTVIEVDSLLLCTGYRFDFEFLNGSDFSELVQEDGHRVTPLYRQLFHPKYQTLFFIGLPYVVIPFPLFDTQVRYCLRLLQHAFVLPSSEVLLRRIEQESAHRLSKLGYPPRKAHLLAGPLQWEYLRVLSEEAEMENLVKPVISKLYDHVHAIRALDLPGYKRYNFKLVNDHEFTQLESEK